MAARSGLTFTNNTLKISESAVLPGTIIAWGYNTTPSGWMLLDGSTLSVAVFPRLYLVFGNVYGGTIGSTFVLPNLIGKTPIGIGTYTDSNGIAGSYPVTRTIGEYGGSEKVGLTSSTIGFPSHTHNASGGSLVTGASGLHAHLGFNDTPGVQTDPYMPTAPIKTWSLCSRVDFASPNQKVTHITVYNSTSRQPDLFPTSKSLFTSDGYYDTFGTHYHPGPAGTKSFIGVQATANSAHNNMSPYLVQKWIVKV